jgi:hypothetical protein
MGILDFIGDAASSSADALTQTFEFEPDYGYIGDAASSSSWFSPIVDTVSSGFTSAFNYIDNNEWAANMLAGGASAGLNYMVQKDANEQYMKALDRREDREDRRYFVGGSPGMGSYGSLTNGLLTNGSLTKKQGA